MTEITIAPAFLGVFFTLIIFLIAFSVDSEEKKNIWKPLLLFMNTPVSLAVGIDYIGNSLFSINWWIGIFFFLFAIVLSLSGCYYGIKFGRSN